LPALLPECRDVAAVWQVAGGQWRLGFNGLFALDWPAVAAVGKWIGVDVSHPRILRGLRVLEHLELTAQAEKQRSPKESD